MAGHPRRTTGSLWGCVSVITGEGDGVESEGQRDLLEDDFRYEWCTRKEKVGEDEVSVQLEPSCLSARLQTLPSHEHTIVEDDIDPAACEPLQQVPRLGQIVPQNHLGLLCLRLCADRLQLLQVLIFQVHQQGQILGSVSITLMGLADSLLHSPRDRLGSFPCSSAIDPSWRGNRLASSVRTRRQPPKASRPTQSPPVDLFGPPWH